MLLHAARCAGPVRGRGKAARGGAVVPQDPAAYRFTKDICAWTAAAACTVAEPPRFGCLTPPQPLLPLLPQNHSNEDIYEKAVAILESYFDVEDGEEENLAPAVAEGGALACPPARMHAPNPNPQPQPACAALDC